MKQTVEKAANDYLNRILESTDFEINFEEDNYDSGSRDAILDVTERAFVSGAEWQAKQLSCISAYEKLLESNKDDFLSHHIDKVKMEIIRIVANDAQAVTFQTLGQYRSWLMKTINELDCPIPEL